MTQSDEFGREPVTIVELEQPRCALRFGVAPCTASTDDGPRCYNTWETCLDRTNIDYSGKIRWRFVHPRSGVFDVGGDEGDNDIVTDAIPCLANVTNSASELNPGAARDGVSPFGARSMVRVTLRDFPWDDSVGDFYVNDRPQVSNAGFWQKWFARNEFPSGMRLRVFEGYKGEALSEMQQRLYVVEDWSKSSGRAEVTIKGIDPLRLANREKASFPRATDIELIESINETQTTGVQILLRIGFSDMFEVFGNTDPVRYIRIGSEILSYTDWTFIDTAQFELTGVVRGVLGTTADSHNAEDGCQRVGHYDNLAAWQVVNDLLVNHTPLPSEFIDLSQWNDEGDTYLSVFTISGTVIEPTPVEDLCGEIMQQTTFYIWWDERKQTIPLRAIRPQSADANLSDENNIVSDSTRVTRDPDAWFSQLFLYYNPRDPTVNVEDATNYERIRGDIDAEVENLEAAGRMRQKIIFSRWITSPGQAAQVASRLIGRYRRIPRYLRIDLDAKDRGLEIGDVAIVRTDADVNSEGFQRNQLWQVISYDEIEPGHIVRYDLQEFVFQVERLAEWTVNSEQAYMDYPADERDVLNGLWWADSDGKMPDGTDGWVWQ